MPTTLERPRNLSRSEIRNGDDEQRVRIRQRNNRDDRPDLEGREPREPVAGHEEYSEDESDQRRSVADAYLPPQLARRAEESNKGDQC